ncbi:serine aminopeptidase domain-containing protein [Cupriavidus sp. CP313]
MPIRPSTCVRPLEAALGPKSPVIVLHGGADPLVKLEDQQPFLDAALTDDVTLRIWPDGEHTIYNHAAERTALVADWFADRFC